MYVERWGTGEHNQEVRMNEAAQVIHCKIF